MSVSKRLRFEILRRDSHTCHYCGRSAPEVKLSVDHVVPEALGGTDDPSNLRAACYDCNGGKSSVPADAPLVAGVSEDAARWAEAIKQVARERAQQHQDRRQLMEWFYGEWNCWTNRYDETYDADGAATTIPSFLEAGLSKDDIVDLIEVAMRSKSTEKWRYFCGCCWNRIRDIQTRAAEIVREAVSPEPKMPLLQTVWTVEQIKEWWQEAMDDAKQADFKPATYCVHTPEGEYEHCGDVVCVAAIAAETLQLASDIEATRWKQKVLAERISDAAEEAEDYVYG